MKYSRVQFKTKVLFATAPWTTLEFPKSVEGLAPGIPTVEAFVLEDADGDNIRVTQGSVTLLVPKSNVASYVPITEPVSTVDAETRRAGDKTLDTLDKGAPQPQVKGPRKGLLR